MARQLINAFNAGEFSEELLGRVDLESLRKACRLCRNFLPRTLGGVRRRPGMLRLGAAKTANRKCRLLPFNFSTSSRFALEAGHQYLRIWKDGALVRDGGNVIIDLAAPWTEAQLFAIQMVQVNDLVFFAHPAFPVQQLRRVTDNNWTLGELPWVWPAMRDRNSTSGTMACSVTTGAGVLVSSVAQFTAGDVGAYYEIIHNRQSAQVALPLTTDSAGSATLRVLGEWEVMTTGAWTGILYLERQMSNGAWATVRSWDRTNENIQATGTAEKETVMRLVFDYNTHSGSATPRAQLEASDPEIRGLVRVTAVTDSTHADVTVIRDLWATTATPEWSEGAWSVKRGFPRAVAIHQQRLVFGGCAAEPQKIWGSALDDFNNFQLLDLENSSFVIQVAAQEANPIVWMASQEGLIIGTEGDEWLLDSGDSVISPTNPPYSKRKTKFGSADLQAQLVGSVVIFVQRGGRAVREYVFAFDEQSYKAPDLSQLSSHLTRGGIAQFAYAQNPDSTIWAVTGAGLLLSCTYKRESEVVAWAAHPTAGQVESVAVIYGAGSADSDEVWLSVRRTIGGVTSRHVERFDPLHWTHWEDGEPARKYLTHYDCAVRKSLGGPTEVVTGLEHLEGAVVGVYADGAAQPDRTVLDGAITLAEEASDVIIGLPYQSILQPFLFDTLLQDGTSQGLKQRTPEVQVRLLKTGGMETADSADVPESGWRKFTFRDVNHVLGSPPPLFSGLTEPIYFQSSLTDGTNTAIRATGGEPLNILAVISHTGIYVR